MNTDTPLGEARDWLRNRIDEGASCPCCQQYARVYRRKITSRQAHGFILVWRAAGIDWVHIPTVHPAFTGDGGKLSMLRYWGLLEEADDKRDDGGRAGWWRITSRGRLYLDDQLRVPKYARTYDGRCLSLVGEPVGIRDALGTRFRYDELMAGV